MFGLSTAQSILSLVLGVPTAAGSLWAVLTYTELAPVIQKSYTLDMMAIEAKIVKVQAALDETTKMAFAAKFFLLKQKKEQNGGLDEEDMRDYCNLAILLQYRNVDGCGF